MKSGIYKIDICGITYVGSAKNFTKRFKRHLIDLQNNNHHNIILQRAYNKYGIKNVKFSIVEEIPYEKKIILEREQSYIDKIKEQGRCANLSGASFGDTMTDHPDRKLRIEKISKTIHQNMDNLTAEERKEKFGRMGALNGMYGKTHTEKVKIILRERNYTEETKNKMSKSAHKKFKEKPELKENLSNYASQRTGEKNPFYGKKHSEETRAKIGLKNKGNKPANRIKISINDAVYDSYCDASTKLNIPAVTIRHRCLSKNKKFENYTIL